MGDKSSQYNSQYFQNVQQKTVDNYEFTPPEA